MISIADFLVLTDYSTNTNDEFEDSDRNEVDLSNFCSIPDPQKINNFLLLNNYLVILSNFQIFLN